MAAKDAAFMWETEALRSSPIPMGASTTSDRRDEGWLTLRETQRVTGIPISTLRKWVRKDAVPSFIDETEDGPIRMLWLQGVTQRAEVLGREIEEPEVAPEPKEDFDLETDLERESRAPEPTPEPTVETRALRAEPAPVPPPAEPAPGTMVVPIEAWDKMLMQLGNLHEAGQQLAEARERAGKAETEAKFLRERLSDLKVEMATAPAPAEVPETPSRRVSIEIEDGEGEPAPAEPPRQVVETAAIDQPGDDAASLTTYSLAVIKHLYGTWRDRPRR
jgi:hypothetical protein